MPRKAPEKLTGFSHNGRLDGIVILSAANRFAKRIGFAESKDPYPAHRTIEPARHSRSKPISPSLTTPRHSYEKTI